MSFALYQAPSLSASSFLPFFPHADKVDVVSIRSRIGVDPRM